MLGMEMYEEPCLIRCAGYALAQAMDSKYENRCFMRMGGVVGHTRRVR